jgi:hypothetical protein
MIIVFITYSLFWCYVDVMLVARTKWLMSAVKGSIGQDVSDEGSRSNRTNLGHISIQRWEKW